MRRASLAIPLLLPLLLCGGCYDWGQFEGGVSCDAGFAHCPGADPGETCETPLNTRENCGACGITCSATCGEHGCTTPVELALGLDHTCARMSDGTVTCWGLNNQGQMGVPLSTSQSPTPMLVPGVQSAVGLVAGHELSCALIDGGTVRCWGRNNELQLGVGDGGPTSRAEALPVPGLVGVTALWGGTANVCVREASGALSCWGVNTSGQVGRGLAKNIGVPTRIQGLPDAGLLQVANGGLMACALLDTGKVWCWGRNTEGELGNGDPVDPPGPVEVSSLGGVQSLAAGLRHVCAIVDGGAAFCWGGNESGQLGAGDAGTFQAAPVQVRGGPFGQLTAAESLTCAMRLGENSPYCWGDNAFGQLGTVTMSTSSTPVRISGTAFDALTTGGNHTCGLAANGDVFCWGQNTFGQLGLGQSSTAPVTVPTLVEW